MRNAIKVGLFLCAVAFFSNGHVNASALSQSALTENPFHYSGITSSSSEDQPKAEPTTQKEKPAKPVEEKKAEVPPVTYTVASGDSLTKIADTYKTDWKRLFYKNTAVADPNTISVGEVLIVPTAEEQLAERPIAEAPVVSSNPVKSSGTSTIVASQARGSTAGNTYTPGYCTWYAKNRRPDLPNRLGNASAWVSSAAAQGFATGSTPQAGAIGQQGNHVVYVEAVNGDGTVTVSEMNYSGLYVISSRTVAASNFMYIY
jgi:surface antigen